MPESIDFQPLVTVYMPTYNRVELLRRAVDSVLTQDYKNIELIVVDDKSTDSTHEYLAKMAKKDSRFKYFINEKNSGACVSRNKAIFAAKGEFITGLDDDDYFLPNRISCFLESWTSKKPSCIALYTHSHIIKKDGRHGKVRRPKYSFSHNLLCSNFVGNQIFTKTIFLKEIGGFDKQLKVWQDLECWYRLLKIFKKKAYMVNNYSYVLDISHPHERITNNKTMNAVEAFDYFKTKHCLGNNEGKILELQLSPYIKRYIPLGMAIKAVLYSPNPYNIKELSLRYIVPRVKKLYSD